MLRLLMVAAAISVTLIGGIYASTAVAGKPPPPIGRTCDDEGNCIDPPGSTTTTVSYSPTQTTYTAPTPTTTTTTTTAAPELPAYDPAYAEGTVSDESTAQLSIQYLGIGGLPTGCSSASSKVTKSNSFTKIWRMGMNVSWCFGGGKVKTINNRRVTGEILTPSLSRLLYPWTWSIVSEELPKVGVTEAKSFAIVRFSMSAGPFKVIGVLNQTDEPWIDITIRGDGTAICSTSAGPVRNCSERT